MENALNTALIITAIGMTLLFLALGLFYGLVSALTAAIRDRPGQHPPPMGGERTEEEAMFQAAAIAVALARAQVESGLEGVGSSWQEAEVPGNQVSSWWMLHHQRQLILNANRWRVV